MASEKNPFLEYTSHHLSRPNLYRAVDDLSTVFLEYNSFFNASVFKWRLLLASLLPEEGISDKRSTFLFRRCVFLIQSTTDGYT